MSQSVPQQTKPTPLIGAERRHECAPCGHVAQVEAVFGDGYYYWPSPIRCPYCKRVMADCSDKYRKAASS